ncbi:hypothetical protein AGIG_G6639 [Arapaima gigas]
MNSFKANCGFPIYTASRFPVSSRFSRNLRRIARPARPVAQIQPHLLTARVPRRAGEAVGGLDGTGGLRDNDWTRIPPLPTWNSVPGVNAHLFLVSIRHSAPAKETSPDHNIPSDKQSALKELFHKQILPAGPRLKRPFHAPPRAARAIEAIRGTPPRGGAGGGPLRRTLRRGRGHTRGMPVGVPPALAYEPRPLPDASTFPYSCGLVPRTCVSRDPPPPPPENLCR